MVTRYQYPLSWTLLKISSHIHLWACTMPSLICKHESTCHVSQLPVASLCILPPWLHHSRMFSWCHLVYLPSHTYTYGYNGTVPRHWCKCLYVFYAFFLWEASCYECCFISHDVSIYFMLDLVDPYGRHYRLPFRSRHRILDIIPLDHSLLPFLLGYFFEGSASMMSFNSVT